MMESNQRFEKQETEVTFEELQNYFNNNLDLPEHNRNLSEPRNVFWLMRNLFNKNKVEDIPGKYLDALKGLAKKLNKQ